MTAIARYPTPLRYPGGKQRLTNFFERLIRLNEISDSNYVEPFAGGGGAGLSLLMRGLVNSIHLNDWDRSIYAFWYAVKHRNSALCDLVRSTRISIAEWDRQKRIQQQKGRASLIELAFSTLFLNRTNRSGILRGGMIGGRAQSGTWNLKSRFDKKVIIDRIQQVGEFSDQISISNKDSLLTDDITFGASAPALVYLDPPYFDKAARLYMNHLDMTDHAHLAKKIGANNKQYLVITYDTSPVILDLYAGYKKRFFNLAHTAADYKVGREVMFFSDNLRVPRIIP